jgi:DNA modification methylase
MMPYYADEHIAVYHGDCRDILPSLPRESVDLIVTDPPYGRGWQSGRRLRKLEVIAGDDGTLDVPEALGLALRTLRDRRHIYVFGGFDLSGLPVGGTCELIWDKQVIGPGDLTLPWGPQHESITFGVHCNRPSHRAAGDGRLAARLRRGSILRVPRPDRERNVRHQTPKPVLLLRMLIESSSIIGETVLDPFMGSGSTLVAARLEGRKAIGIDSDERHCAAATAWLSEPVPVFGGVS